MAEHFRVNGGARLTGEVRVVGAKNSVLKLMAAALLAEGTTTLTNCPEILDVPLMADVLRSLGCTAEVDGATVRITSPAMPRAEARPGPVGHARVERHPQHGDVGPRHVGQPRQSGERGRLREPGDRGRVRGADRRVERAHGVAPAWPSRASLDSSAARSALRSSDRLNSR